MKRTVIWLEPEVVDRLDQLAARVRAEKPGRGCSRANVVRALLAAVLAVVEGQDTAFDNFVLRAMPPRKKKGKSPVSSVVLEAPPADPALPPDAGGAPP